MKYCRISATIAIVTFFALPIFCFYQFSWRSLPTEDYKPNIAGLSFAKSDRKHYDSPYSAQSSFLRYRNHQLACRLMQMLKQRDWIVVTAESVSAGNLAAALARSPGAGAHFAGGAVCYKIEAKRQLLAVPDQREQQLYDLQTAQDMARGAQRLFQIDAKGRVTDSTESYHGKPVLAIATTGRAVSYPSRWQGGVYVGLAFPDGQVTAAYFTHDFPIWPQGQDQARTKDEGMLAATTKALAYTVAQLEAKTREK